MDYPQVIEDAARDLAPHLVAFYLKDLAAGFHSYYKSARFLVDDSRIKHARLALVLAIGQVLRNGLTLLGVSAPARCSRRRSSGWHKRPGEEVRRAGGATGHPMMIGVFMGVLLGLCAALAVALYLYKASPFVARDKDSAASKPSARTETPKGPPAGFPTQPPPVQQAPSQSTKPQEAKQADTKQRFDFYTILPGKTEPKAEQSPKAGQSGPEHEVIYLQAGAFQKSSDADNLKARLALAGLEAQIQTATLSDQQRVAPGAVGSLCQPGGVEPCTCRAAGEQDRTQHHQTQRARPQALT